MEKIMQNKKFIKIICVLLALLLWLYVSYQENPSMSKTVKNVPIVIAGEQALKEKGFSVYSVSDTSVNVKATAKRMMLARLTNKTLSASVNVSSIKSSGKHTIPASIVSTISSSASYYVKGKDITVVIEPIETKRFTADADIKTSEASSVVVESYTLSRTDISVSAPKSIIEDIAYIKTEPIDPGEKSGSKAARLVAYAKNGKILEGVECSPAEVTVSYVVYNEKILPVVLKTSDGKSHQLPEQYTAKVYGLTEELNNLQKIDTQKVNLSDYKPNDRIKVKISLPEGVFANPGHEEIEIELKEKYFEKD